MKRITTALLLGAAAAVALAPLVACEDDTTVNTAFKDAGSEGGEGGEGGKNEGGAASEGGAADAADAATTDANDDGG